MRHFKFRRRERWLRKRNGATRGQKGHFAAFSCVVEKQTKHRLSRKHLDKFQVILLVTLVARCCRAPKIDTRIANAFWSSISEKVGTLIKSKQKQLSCVSFFSILICLQSPISLSGNCHTHTSVPCCSVWYTSIKPLLASTADVALPSFLHTRL